MTDILDNVSRETLDRLEIYVAELTKWNRALNLVSASSLKDVWSRHIRDALQITSHADPMSPWVDLGSGGGIPGLIIAATRPSETLVLIESDERKSAFLRSAAIAMDVQISIVTSRIESATPQMANVLTARALAPLTQLLHFAERHRLPQGKCLFLKGQSAHHELTEAKKTWKMEVDVIPSVTSKDGVILRIGAFSRV